MLKILLYSLSVYFFDLFILGVDLPFLSTAEATHSMTLPFIALHWIVLWLLLTFKFYTEPEPLTHFKGPPNFNNTTQAHKNQGT